MSLVAHYFFLYKIENLLYLNLSVYACKTPSWRLKLRPCSHTLQALIGLLSVIELLSVKEKETKKKNL